MSAYFEQNGLLRLKNRHRTKGTTYSYLWWNNLEEQKDEETLSFSVHTSFVAIILIDTSDLRKSSSKILQETFRTSKSKLTHC